MKRILLWAALVLTPWHLNAQETFPENGARNVARVPLALSNATLVKSPGDTIFNAVILIKDGRIQKIGSGNSIPAGYVHHDLNGAWVYPGFIDLFSDYGIPPRPKTKNEPGPEFLSRKNGAYSWNQALKPEQEAASEFRVQEKQAGDLRKDGFALVQTVVRDGIARGNSALVYTGNGPEQEMLVPGTKWAHMSFSKGSSTQDYPSSQMGAIALIRQAFYDAQWYRAGGYQQEENLSLKALSEQNGRMFCFEVNNSLEALRAQKIAEEFRLRSVIKTGNDAYQFASVLKARGCSLIVPLNFPLLPDVRDPLDAGAVGLKDLMHWERAPENPALLAQEGLPFVLTSYGLEKGEDFIKNLQKAVRHGLDPAMALKALTSLPAQWLQLESYTGTVAEGKEAHLVIADQDLFGEKGKILGTLIKGVPYWLDAWKRPILSGTYQIEHPELIRMEWDKEGKKGKLFTVAGDSLDLSSIYSNGFFTLTASDQKKVDYRMALWEEGSGHEEGLDVRTNRPKGFQQKEYKPPVMTKVQGRVEKAGVQVTVIKATQTGDAGARSGADKKKEDENAPNADSLAGPDPDAIHAPKRSIRYPFEAYGMESRPVAVPTLIKNATVWTNEPQGILERADVLIRNGKIERIGTDLDVGASGLRIIEARGMHLTSGIIDEHSHIAINNGVNEGTQASSAEVRIGDVLDPTSIHLYRQLGGGVTAAQLLHGSANPIGGQSALIKFRWGSLDPEDLKIKGVDGFIKFALGENVKQSNWGDDQTTRFPQTRMGVEQVFVDHFSRAADYLAAQKQWAGLKPKQKQGLTPPRRDLELEALGEILEKKRFITCHSYIQSEILMLMALGDSMGFKVNTFTHILEGYKVAPQMAAHGAGGSTFADWWAYKFEVYDAIPYNAALMHRAGVVVAINSDDAEMARRLNQEAAKAVKYGGISEEEAWKMVTLNPAKLLHLDHRMGSIKVSKDADLVLWTAHPLSIEAKAEKTWVDGLLLFDRALDHESRVAQEQERSRLVQKVSNEIKKGGKVSKEKTEPQPDYHCMD